MIFNQIVKSFKIFGFDNFQAVFGSVVADKGRFVRRNVNIGKRYVIKFYHRVLVVLTILDNNNIRCFKKD